MENSILYMLRRYWYLIVLSLAISLPLTYLGLYRTNEALILKGGANNFVDVVEIDTDYKVSGSFSTLYVISMERSTKLQNLITKNDPTIERYTMSTDSASIGDIDSYRASKIEYDSSISNALILAYKEANKVNNTINIVYEFKGYDVTYYSEKSRFRIGDRIVKIKSHYYNDRIILPTNEAEFRKAINNLTFNSDIITIERNNELIDIDITSDDYFYGYSMYDIDANNTKPGFKIKNTSLGGPSGGLLQTLSIYDRLTGNNLTKGKKIAGTGTISYKGEVGAIGGIKEKVPTAVDNNIDVFFCPSVNYEDALLAYNSLPNSKRMKLVKIDTFYDALNYLKNM